MSFEPREGSAFPDVRSAAFLAQAHRQSLAVANSENAADDQAFIDSVSELGDG
ncbi:MAG: antitoxin MazE-like protein [Gemmatimonadales bacterium]